ncbi:hypothetical protein D3C74_353960 [compost metagenome]
MYDIVQLGFLFLGNTILSQRQKIINDTVGPIQLFQNDPVIVIQGVRTLFLHQLKKAPHNCHGITHLMRNACSHLPYQTEPIHIIEFTSQHLKLRDILNDQHGSCYFSRRLC